MVYNVVSRSMNLSGMRHSWNSVVGRFYRNSLLFFHVPKCGGTAISHPFRVKYMFSARKIDEEASARACAGLSPDQWMRFKQQLFLYHAATGCHYVQGHVPYAPAAFRRFADSHVFMTVLREPRDRVVSHYFFDPRTNCMSFADFLDSDRGRIECSVYSRFFGGLPFAEPQTTEAHVASAIESLESFDVVGILEQQEDLQRQVRRALGISLKAPKRNVGTLRRTKDAGFGAAERARLEAMCEGDRRIYEHFRARSGAH